MVSVNRGTGFPGDRRHAVTHRRSEFSQSDPDWVERLAGTPLSIRDI